MTLILFIIYAPYECAASIGAALLHEFGHIICTKISNVKLCGFTAGICGADITVGACTYKTEILIFSGGCLFNAIGFLLFKSTTFGLRNATYALLNAMPVGCLDGGRVLSSLLSSFFGIVISKRICTALSILTLFAMWQFGIFILFKTSSNFTLFLFCLYIFAFDNGSYTISE